jgi:hypothetical protein
MYHLQGLDCRNHGKLIAYKPVTEEIDTALCIQPDTVKAENITYESTIAIPSMKHEKPEIKERESVSVSIPEPVYLPVKPTEKIQFNTEKISTFRPMEQSYLFNDYGIVFSLVLTSYVAYRYTLNSVNYWSSLIRDLRNV